MNKQGFTLVEIMIVAAIIGLLSAFAIPSFQRVRWNSRVSAVAHDIRLAVDAFELYAIQEGNYPADVNRGIVPAGMKPFLPRSLRWTEPTAVGGAWDWDRNVFGFSAGVSIVGNALSDEIMRALDKLIDDGNLATGNFKKTANDRYTYIIRP